MIKPFTLKIKEIEQEFIKVINNSDLPAFCIKTILQSIIQEIQKIDEEEIQKYQKELQEQEKNLEKEEK